MATGIKVGQLPQDDVITGSEKVLISDNGVSKFATVDQIKNALKDNELHNTVSDNAEAITYLTNKLKDIEEGTGDSDPWIEF